MSLKHPGKSRILKETLLREQKWLDVTEITYRDEGGNTRFWECVHRKQKTEAAMVVAQMVPSGRYIVIKQFRPPAGSYMLEFPAGLIDQGETPAQTALRELQEETGYRGRIVSTSPRLYLSPGILSESCYLVRVEVDETLPMNQAPQPMTEPGEDIEVFLITPKDLPGFIRDESSKGSSIDIKFYIFFNHGYHVDEYHTG